MESVIQNGSDKIGTALSSIQTCQD